MRGMRLGLAVMTLALWIGPGDMAAPHSLADLKKSQPEPIMAVPEPIPGKGCPVPPIPGDPRYVEGEGWSLNHLISFRNFDLDGMRFYVEYQIVRRNDDGSVVTRPFPTTYMLDLNRNGVFEVPGEIWQDAKGDGRCADLVPVQPPADGEVKKPLA